MSTDKPTPIPYPHDRTPEERPHADPPAPLTRAELLAFDTRATIRLTIPPLGPLHFRAPPLREVMRFASRVGSKFDPATMSEEELLDAFEASAPLVASSLTDPDGELLLTADEVEELFDRIPLDTSLQLIDTTAGLCDDGMPEPDPRAPDGPPDPTKGSAES